MRRWVFRSLVLVLLLALSLWLWLSRLNQTVELTVDCGSGGLLDFCLERARIFTEQMGIRTEVKASPADAHLHFNYLKEVGRTHSSHLDVYLLEAAWVGAFAEHLLALPKQDPSVFFSTCLDNNTYKARLLALPYTVDFGVLYARTDLLARYNAALPESYVSLADSAKEIQAQERSLGNEALWGYLWPGKGEAFSAQLLEWLAADGAGTAIERNGDIILLTQMSIRSLDQVQQWFGTITPPEVFSLDEQMLSDWWRMGRGIFMRYQAQRYLLEPPDGSTVVAPLPRGTVAAATVLSGWQLAVSKYSQYPKEAQAFIEFMTSMESQRVLAQRRYLPANRRVYAEPDVQAVDPIYSWALGAMSHAILRPSTVTASRYSEVSEVLQHGVAEALQKQQVPQEAIQNLADRLSGIKAAGW